MIDFDDVDIEERYEMDHVRRYISACRKLGKKVMIKSNRRLSKHLAEFFRNNNITIRGDEAEDTTTRRYRYFIIEDNDNIEVVTSNYNVTIIKFTGDFYYDIPNDEICVHM